MDKDSLIEYCANKQGAHLDFPFGDGDYAVFKIANERTGKNRIFAEIFTLKGEDMLTFSTDSEIAICLRNQFAESVQRGWHCPPVQAKYKSSAKINFFDGDTIKQFVDMSYEYATKKLRICK